MNTKAGERRKGGGDNARRSKQPIGPKKSQTNKKTNLMRRKNILIQKDPFHFFLISDLHVGLLLK